MSTYTLYGRTSPYCPECERVKATMVNAGIEYNYVELTQEVHMELMKEYHTLGRSLPIVTLDGVLIGARREFEEHRAQLAESSMLTEDMTL